MQVWLIAISVTHIVLELLVRFKLVFIFIVVFKLHPDGPPKRGCANLAYMYINKEGLSCGYFRIIGLLH